MMHTTTMATTSTSTIATATTNANSNAVTDPSVLLSTLNDEAILTSLFTQNDSNNDDTTSDENDNDKPEGETGQGVVHRCPAS